VVCVLVERHVLDLELAYIGGIRTELVFQLKELGAKKLFNL